MSLPLDLVDLAPGVTAAFSGRHPGQAGDGAGGGAADGPSGLVDPANLAHHRPHVPSLLAAARRDLAAGVGVAPDDLHLMRQVHGARVAVVDADVAPGAELRGVDAMVTAEPGRALVVQAADCVPVLAAGAGGPVGVAHAGRGGVEAGVAAELVTALRRLSGGAAADLHAAVGPAIGGCCYEVPEAMAAEVAAAVTDRAGREVAASLAATTTWGTTSLDLPAAVAAQLRHAGVEDVRPSPGCTRCGGAGRWFSHRRDPASGRHAGVVVIDRVAGRVAA